MKNLRIINLLLIASFLFINISCSVEKKHYSNGYYVKWHHSHNTLKTIKPSTESKTPDIITSVTTQKDLPTLGFNEDEFSVLYKSESVVILSQEEELIEVEKSQEPLKPKLSKPHYKEMIKGVKMAQDLVRDVNQEKSTQRMHGLAVAGFVLALVGWFTPVNIALILLILGIVFAAVALGAISKNPEAYKGSGLAIAAFVVALIGFVIIIAV